MTIVPLSFANRFPLVSFLSLKDTRSFVTHIDDCCEMYPAGDGMGFSFPFLFCFPVGHLVLVILPVFRCSFPTIVSDSVTNRAFGWHVFFPFLSLSDFLTALPSKAPFLSSLLLLLFLSLSEFECSFPLLLHSFARQLDCKLTLSVLKVTEPFNFWIVLLQTRGSDESNSFLVSQVSVFFSLVPSFPFLW